MKYTIYRGAQVVIADITPEGTVTEKIMGEETVNITFSHTSKIEFHIDDKITVYGKDYFLSADPVTVKKSSREFQYTLLFFSVKYALSDVQMFFYDDENELTLPDFSIMGTAEDCLNVVLANANRAQSGWSKGTVDETEVKNVSFSDCKCLEAISKIADEFELEYWIDSDKSIHFTERKPVSGYSFEYGKAKGLKDITRSVLEGGSLVTRLYVKGAEKNLPKNYRGGQKNLRIDVPYLEKNTNVYGIKEHIESFPDIFPRRVGTVTSVDANDPNRFTDADLDFDLNAYNEYGTTVLLNGIAAKVIFQTGQLAGYRFELLETGGFSSATKTFYLNPNKDEKDLQLPSESMRPAVGDQYILEDIMMPEVYVLQAEAELKNKGQDYLDQNSKERFQYAVISDILYFKNQNINVLLGHSVHFKDVDFGLDDAIRITGLQKNIQNPYDVKFDLSEVTAVSSIVQSYYEQQEQTNTIITSIKYNAELARRNYLFAREFHDNVFDGEGYYKAENIKPLSIETKMLSLGSRLQQFGLPGVNFQLQNNNALSNTAGKIAHQTIDPNAIREWNITANTVIGISNAFNYIYIKCQKIGTNANFVVTQAQIKVEQDPDFYHFEVGYLSSVVDGYRKIKTTYGFAQLNPAELSIGRISDPTGNNYIDLKQDGIGIKAKVEFTNDSPAFQQMNDTIVIGGRNLILNSNGLISPISSYSAVASESPNIPPQFTTGKSTKVSPVQDVHFLRIHCIKEVGTYTFSAWIKRTNGNNYPLQISANDLGSKNFQITNTEWRYITHTIEVTNVSDVYNFFDLRTDTRWVEFLIYNPKIEKGTKATDWTPAPEDVEEQITAVQTYATTVNNLVSDIANDNKITPSEKQQLKQEYDIIVAEKPQISAQAMPYHITAQITAYNAAYNNLVIYVNPLIVNLNNTSDVDGVTLRSRFTSYYTAKVNLLKAITDSVDNNLDTVWTEMENLQNSVNQEIADVTQQVNNLEGYVDGSFADGIISQAEAVAIETHINQINTEKADIDNKYNQIYNDSYLSGTPKTNLATDYNNYVSSHTNLINSINTAISDGATTPAEKADVDSKFSAYRLALGVLTTRFQEAIKAIETATVNAIQVGGRNLALNSKGFIDSNSDWVRNFKLSEKLFAGQQCTIRIKFRAIGSPNDYFHINDINGNNSFDLVKINPLEFGLTFTANADFTEFVLVRYPLGSGSWCQFESLKIEKGNKATDWTPAPEDIDVAIAGANGNAANALAQAQNAQTTAAAAAAVTSFMHTTIDGNVVSTGTLQVGDVNGANAMISGVTDRPNGESIRFAAGKNYANKYLSPFQVLDNGMVRFVNPLTGQKTFELGFNQNSGKVVFDIYNDNGIKVASIGSQGIMFTGYIPESYTKRKFRKLNTTSFTETAIKADLTASIMLKWLFDRYPNTGMATDTTQYFYEIGLNTNVVAWEYNEGRNFESAGNAQYAGLYTSENKLGPKLPDGIYLKQFITVGWTQVSSGQNSVEYWSEAYLVSNGRIINSMEISKTLTISQIPNKPSKWLPEDYE